MILWQWINQSYNAVFNYSNRNTSTESNNMDILKAYCSATVVSVGVALAGNKLVAKMGGGGLLGKVVLSPLHYRVVHSVVRCGVRWRCERVPDALQGDAHGHHGDGQGRQRAGREQEGGHEGGEPDGADARDSAHSWLLHRLPVTRSAAAASLHHRRTEGDSLRAFRQVGQHHHPVRCAITSFPNS